MPECKVCHTRFTNRARIDDRIVNLSNRKFCLSCSPFGQHNTKQLERGCTKRRIGRAKQIREWKERVGTERKQKLVDLKGGGCEICKYSRCLRALHFHHLHPSEKSFCLNIRTLGYYGWEKCLKEAEKTQCLCANCHSEVEDGIQVGKRHERT